MFLDANIAGQITSTPPIITGNVVQFIGKALSPTSLSFEPRQGIVLA